MKDFSKATPRPWATKQTHILSEATWYVIIDPSGRGPIMDVGGKEIAEAKYLTTDPLEIQTNAELIVTAVNNFDKMKEALEWAVDLVEESHKEFDTLTSRGIENLNKYKQLLESLK